MQAERKLTGGGRAISADSAILLNDACTRWTVARRVVAARLTFNRIPRHWIVFAAGAALLFLFTSWCAEGFAVRNTDRALARYASTAAALRVTGLQSVLEKHRTLPLVLSDDADIRATLLSPTPKGIERLNLKLHRMSVGASVSVIYILNRQGETIASSNWNDPASFVGKAYTFRPYFKGAMQNGVAEYFAFGATSHRSGLYFAHRVDGADGGLGVVVVKEQFDKIEAQWRASSEPTFVTDRNGTVLLTTDDAWRFRRLQDAAPVHDYVAPDSLQFGSGLRGPLPLRNVGGDKIEDPSRRPARHYAAAEVAAAAPGWTLHLLAPADRARANAVALARVVAFLGTTTLMVIVGVLYHRRLRALANATAHERTRLMLETQVEARTHELRKANEKLVREMDERRRAEAKLLAAQDGLTQSNKLATLGQIAAGVAHEINQPVAAIRAYADNSVVLLDRKRMADARANLGFIATLTEKIDVITNEMKDFSRKSQSKTEIIDLHAAIEGALFLTGWRLRSCGVVLNMEPKGEDIHVFGDKARIEQVLVNLINNAIDALAGVVAPKIDVRISTSRGNVTLALADNGHGILSGDAQSIFSPFFTTKKDGLGLGLVISRDIVTELGGELSFESRPSRGSKFFMTLRRAVSCSPK
jgi:two-component system C4-dicarboxylate transport sensor histidine kinase DctB